MSNGMRRFPADVTCLPLADSSHRLSLSASRIVHAALNCLLIYPHICRIPQIRMTSARHRVGRYAARWDEWLFPDRPLIGQAAQNSSVLTTPSTMAVPLAGAGGEPGLRRQLVDDLVGVSLLCL